MNFNRVIIAGNLTRDPDLKYTPKGTAVCRIGVAINRKWRTESGEDREEVVFVDVDSFGKTAETIGNYFRKGKPIFIEGRLKLDTWEDKQTGANRSKLGVIAERFCFVGYDDDGQGSDSGGRQTSRSGPGGSAQPTARQQAQAGASQHEQGAVEDDSDIPF